MEREPITSQTILKRKFEELVDEFYKLEARVDAIESRRPGRPRKDAGSEQADISD